MSKITKRQLHNGWHCHDTEIIKMKKELRELKQSVLRLEKLTDEKLLDEPQLKQLDQSVFNNIHERWRFAAVDKCGEAYVYVSEPESGSAYFVGGNGTDYRLFGQGYDASDWQNSLIERDVDKELTGSDLARAMLERGDKYVMCLVNNYGLFNMRQDEPSVVIHHCENGFYVRDSYYEYAMPINNQGEPLTAAEAGL